MDSAHQSISADRCRCGPRTAGGQADAAGDRPDATHNCARPARTIRPACGRDRNIIARQSNVQWISNCNQIARPGRLNILFRRSWWPSSKGLHHAHTMPWSTTTGLQLQPTQEASPKPPEHDKLEVALPQKRHCPAHHTAIYFRSLLRFMHF